MCVDMFPRSFSENLHAFGIAALSDWNSLADYRHDQAPELRSFRRQFKTFLLVHCWVQYTENIRDTMTVCRETSLDYFSPVIIAALDLLSDLYMPYS